MRIFLILAPILLLAQPQSSCDTPQSHQLDFWVGEWSVSSNSKPVGQSVITKELNSNIDYEGEWTERALQLESNRLIRLTFTPIEDKGVRRQKERLENGPPITVEDFLYKREAAAVQESSSKPGCTTPQSRQFDFWVGNWKVYNPANELARQVWVSAEGALDLQGDLIDGSIRYTGETTGLNGVTQESLVFTPNPDGTIRQLWQQSPDGGNTWRVNFDGLYRSAPQTRQ